MTVQRQCSGQARGCLLTVPARVTRASENGLVLTAEPERLLSSGLLSTFFDAVRSKVALQLVLWFRVPFPRYGYSLRTSCSYWEWSATFSFDERPHTDLLPLLHMPGTIEFVNGMGATVLGMDGNNVAVRTEQGRRHMVHHLDIPGLQSALPFQTRVCQHAAETARSNLEADYCLAGSTQQATAARICSPKPCGVRRMLAVCRRANGAPFHDPHVPTKEQMDVAKKMVEQQKDMSCTSEGRAGVNAKAMQYLFGVPVSRHAT